MSNNKIHNSNNFFNVLFDPNDQICIGSLHTTSLVKMSAWRESSGEFVSVNALRESRKDTNVTCYRNLLFEMDTLTIDKQTELWKQSGLPISCMTFSGNKSVHVILSLENSLCDVATYSALWTLVADYIDKYCCIKLVDRNTKNPSRFTRVPGRIRRDTRMEQKLLYVDTRVINDDLYGLVGIPVVPTPTSSKLAPVRLTKSSSLLSGLPHYLREKIYDPEDWVEVGRRNTDLFTLASTITRLSGCSKDELVAVLENVRLHLNSTGFTDREFYRTVENGWNFGSSAGKI